MYNLDEEIYKEIIDEFNENKTEKIKPLNKLKLFIKGVSIIIIILFILSGLFIVSLYLLSL